MRILGGFFEINVFLLLSSRDAAGVALCTCCQATALDIAEQQGLVDQAPAPSPYLLEDLAPYSGGSIKKNPQKTKQLDACSRCYFYKHTHVRVWPQRAKLYNLNEMAEVPPTLELVETSCRLS